MPDKLTLKEEAFCLAYADTGDATQSYIEAGYSVKKRVTATVNGFKLLAKDKINRRLQEIARDRQSDRIMSSTEMQEHLTEIGRDKSVRAQERAKAMELLAKMQGALMPREQNNEITINVNITDL